MGTAVEHSEDGRWIIVDGRRWRASDPSIPRALRAELVHELMDARREVASGNRAGDRDRVAAARARVRDAKVALGERGAAWWEQPAEAALADRLEASMLALLRHRAQASTICPSDAARVAGGEQWRDLMALARLVAFRLQDEGRVEVRERGARVESPDAVAGPLRIARGRAFG